MERFVFVAAVTIALMMAAFYALGPSVSFSIGADGLRTDPVLPLRPETQAARLYAATGLDVRYAAAQIVITPEDRGDISISIDNPGRTPMPLVRIEDGKLIVDGRLRGRVQDCGEGQVRLRGYGVVAAADLPRVEIHAPRTLEAELANAGLTQIGPSHGLDLSLTGCGAAQIDDVEGPLSIDISGAGPVATGAVGGLEADISGAGGLHTGAVAQRAKIDLAGGGAVQMASLIGALEVDGAGSGALAVQGGALTDANIDLAGSGGVSIAAPVRRLQVSIVGSGDVEVAGTVGDIDADIAGSGGVRARAVTGAVRKEVLGSGDVVIAP